MMDSSPSKMNSLKSFPPTAGVKRPAPSLLPAFEPLSSSPGLPRPSKRRRARSSPSQQESAYAKYPTPIPTSTTGILSSSPPRVQGRPNSQRAHSVSERAPLSDVPTVHLSDNGDTLRMGRSSNSSHYQLSANRLISRVHVEARYIPASVPLEPNKVEIVCKGWNGVKLHCQGRTWELAKDDTFTSETEYAEIMLDVQDARVLIAWPGVVARKESVGADSSWDDENSPTRARVTAVSAAGQIIDSSPLRRDQARLESPVSPTPAGPSMSRTNLADLFSDDVEPSVVKVYEDSSSPSPEHKPEVNVEQSMVSTQAATSFPVSLEDGHSSDLSEPEDEERDQDPDEENDPIVHSFGPYGANISSRMASFTAGGSPEVPRTKKSAKYSKTTSSSDIISEAEAIPIVNHVVNQLAFSRLSSTPLSVIMNHLPADIKAGVTTNTNSGLTKGQLCKVLDAAPSIGKIHREGKDAAGKPLESEYYYIPDMDTDEQRRAAVVDGLRKPSLRNCRKQHKQYYWKRPRTP